MFNQMVNPVTVSVTDQLRSESTVTPPERDIEQVLIWAYRDQNVRHAATGIMDEGRREWLSTLAALGYSPDSVARMASAGTGASAQARRTAAASVDEAALRVHAAVTALPADVAHLVILHAERATRPGYGADLPKYEASPAWLCFPRWNANGLPEQRSFHVVYSDVGRRTALYCPVIYVSNASLIAAHRDRYTRWHAALMSLAAALDSSASCLGSIAPPSVSAQPWIINALD